MTDATFKGQTALITGAASGIGLATARLLARQGARVMAADLNEAGVQQAMRHIEAEGGIALAQRLDVTCEADWQAAVARIERDWSALHILVNCAGIAWVGTLPDTSLADWRRVLAVNLDGTFLGMRAALPALRRAGGGSIVNVASASGIKAATHSAAYCASKAAVIMLTKAAALECKGEAIRINAVAPGGVKTPMWSSVPMGAEIMTSAEWTAASHAPAGTRFAEPEEIAQAIAFLASPAASYITGCVLPVDAGYTV